MGAILLFLTALIWGCAFLFQKLGGDHVGPFAFTVYRNVLAGVFLLGVLAARRQLAFGRAELVGGAWCGFALWVPSMLQQIAIADTSPGTCAFLTANYALVVPLLGLALGRRPPWYVWPGVAVALAGTFLICLKGAGEFALGRGEALTLLCAVFYAGQILVVDHFVAKADVLALSCVQFFTGAVLGLPFLALPSEAIHLNFADIRAACIAIAFCGVLSSGVAYKNWTQLRASSPPASPTRSRTRDRSSSRPPSPGSSSRSNPSSASSSAGSPGRAGGSRRPRR